MSAGHTRMNERTGMFTAGNRMLVCMAAIGGALALSGCQRSFDVYFANPCDHAISIETFSLPKNEIQERRQPDEVAELPAMSMVKVNSAFDDLSPEVTTRVSGGRFIESDVRHLVHGTVIVPANFC